MNKPTLICHHPDHADQSKPLPEAVCYVIGRGRGCDIRIQDSALGRRHAEFRMAPEGPYVRSLGANHPVSLNGEPVRQAGPLVIGDEIRLGTARLEIAHEPGQGQEQDQAQNQAPEATEPGPALASQSAAAPTSSQPQTSAPPDKPAAPATGASPAVSSARDTPSVSAELIQRFQEAISQSLDLYHRDILQTLSLHRLREQARDAAWQIIRQGEIPLPGDLDAEQVVTTVVAETVGLGPIETLMKDDAISEIMVNGPEQIYVERGGRVEPSRLQFSSQAALASVLERIVSPLGRRLDEGSPLVDARLPDGSRVNAIIPPLALNGAAVTIRRFSQSHLGLNKLVEFGALSSAMAAFLISCIHHRQNILISGGTGTGKTTILNALSEHIAEDERIITIEDSAELRLQQDHVVALEARPPNIEGSGAIPIRDLVRNALRMRPDRILVGECRGGEALDMLQAMNTGHDGSLTTAHANSPRDALARLEVMTLMAGMALPAQAIRDQISSAIDIVIQLTRFSDGARRVTAITEVAGMEGDCLLLTELFRYQRSAPAAGFQATGQIPAFYETLQADGLSPDLSVFQAPIPS